MQELEEKKWLIDRIEYILGLLSDELSDWRDAFSEARSAAIQHLLFIRNTALSVLGFAITIALGFSAIGGLTLFTAQVFIVAFLVIALIVYLTLNVAANAVAALLGPIEGAYSSPVERLAFFQAILWKSTLKLDNVKLEQLYLCESFITVLLAEGCAPIRVGYQGLLKFEYASRQFIKAKIKELDELVRKGYDTYNENALAYSENKEFFGSSLSSVEQFVHWYEKQPRNRNKTRR